MSKNEKGKLIFPNADHESIIEIYGLVTKKIIINLLPYFFIIFIKK
jgi:hypothetical protein